MFRRKRAEPPGPPADPDPHLPLLSVEDAAVLAELARRMLAEGGVETLYDGAGALVAGSDGHSYGLSNLSAAVASAPRSEWPRIVGSHMETLIDSEDVVAPGSLDEARHLLQLKLVAGAQIPESWPTYAPEVLPGVRAVIALDYPTHVSHLTRADALEPYGGWAAVEPVALDNLRRLPAPDHLRIDGPVADSAIDMFQTDDFYGASRFLVLDELLTTSLGIERPSHGVLVAMPHRHMLLVHVLGGVGIVDALNGLIQIASTEYNDKPGSISPEVFYRAVDGRTQQVTRTGADGGVVVEITGPIAEAMQALGLVEGD